MPEKDPYYKLTAEQFVPYPLEEVFPFFERPENLKKITPQKLGFQVLTPSPIGMKAGTLIDYTIKLFGIRIRWTTLITEYDPPYKFVDAQLKGPYSFWYHTHTLEEKDGGTWIYDDVRYMIPAGPIGHLLHSIYIKNDLKNIFDFRRKVIEKEFPAKC